ncbi:MAG: D-alanine--D-alanine ligase [Thermoleophilia bacterium]|nr:D-alanine--D-alanine ligase [Thermoleophilia bacterium]
MSKQTIAVLKGGRSLERNISLKSGARVEKALREKGYATEGIDVDESLVKQLKDLKPDAAFIAMHGRSGEDGTIQELLDILDIPYTGSDVLPSIRCMDKVLSKHIFVADGIPTPPFYAFNRDAFQELGAVDTMPIIGKELGYPIVVKPAAQGSALGIRFAHTESELPAALISAFSFDNKVLLEKYVKGTELAVSILGKEPRALPIVEVRPKTDFFDFESRYTMGKADYLVPAEIPEAAAAEVTELSLRVFKTLGCSGFGRVDIMMDESGGLQVLEINTIPGFTETSLLPMAAQAVGIGFNDLVEEILLCALEG